MAGRPKTHRKKRVESWASPLITVPVVEEVEEVEEEETRPKQRSAVEEVQQEEVEETRPKQRRRASKRKSVHSDTQSSPNTNQTEQTDLSKLERRRSTILEGSWRPETDGTLVPPLEFAAPNITAITTPAPQITKASYVNPNASIPDRPDRSYVSTTAPPATTTTPPDATQPAESKNLEPFMVRLIRGDFFFGKQQEQFRTIYVNQNRQLNTSKYSGNSISTQKYSILTFLPKFLWEQFGRASNFFFLFTACIALVPQAAVIDPVLAVAPLIIVLVVAAIKEMVEDIRRYLADRSSNNQPVSVLHNDQFTRKRWADVVVGDIIKFEDGQQMCADILLLSTSEPHGVCFVETSSLDGETNLKIRQCPRETLYLKTEQQLAKLVGVLKCEAPNNRLYVFEGTLDIQSGLEPPTESETAASRRRLATEAEPQQQQTPFSESAQLSIGPTEVVLRGSSIQNTKWIYGLVFNTGHDTKLFKNSNPAPIKQTELQRQLNRQVLAMFFFVMGMAIAITVARIVWDNQMGGVQPWYLPSVEYADIFQFLSGILLIQNVIPIGLFVELEVARFIQGLLLSSDPKMYYAEKDIWARAPSSTLNEELGQISHIFSDKTGTLTQNKMVFRKCVVRNKIYGGTAEEQPKTELFDGTEILADLHGKDELAAQIHEFLTILSVCHTVIPESKKNEDGTATIKYQASSPDEFALVTAAKNLGFEFRARQPDSVIVNVEGVDREFEILQVNEFNSTRKRMSVIVMTPEGKIMLYCKGADNVIFERLADNDQQKQQRFITEQRLNDYSRIGLRTLCLASKEIPEDVYQNWLRVYIAASVALVNRSDLLEKAAEMIEQDMNLIGATAIEDKLQDGVPETLVMLARAGIRVWVLTGDKQETAINIGLSAQLLEEDMDIMIANGDENWLREFVSKNLSEKLAAKTPSSRLALVIDGSTLIHALETDLRKNFLELAMLCRSVVCCRVSPLQKAKVVTLVKDNTNSRTLAIGDGANDVSMIQAAAIGVGIQGEEGGQAARAADFSIGQFRFLQSLLLLHGSWNYFRQARLILFQFYLQVIYNTSLFYYSTIAAWSEIVIYQNLLSTLFYTVFTGIDVVFPTLFDRNIQAKKMFLFPEAYRSNIDRPLMSITNFWIRWFIGLVHSILLFVFVLFALGPDYESVFEFGNILLTCIIITVKIVLYLDIVRINKVDITAITIAIILFVVCQLIFSQTLSTDDTYAVYYYVVPETASHATSWFLFILGPMTVVITYITYRYVMVVFYPSDFQILNEISWVDKQGALWEMIDHVRRGNLRAIRSTRSPHRSDELELQEIAATNARGSPRTRALTSTFDSPETDSSGVRQATLVRMYGNSEDTPSAREERQNRRLNIWKNRKVQS